jgi:hypothetical protein
MWEKSTPYGRSSLDYINMRRIADVGPVGDDFESAHESFMNTNHFRNEFVRSLRERVHPDDKHRFEPWLCPRRFLRVCHREEPATGFNTLLCVCISLDDIVR